MNSFHSILFSILFYSFQFSSCMISVIVRSSIAVVTLNDDDDDPNNFKFTNGQ